MSMNKKKSKEERERMEKLYIEENKTKEHKGVSHNLLGDHRPKGTHWAPTHIIMQLKINYKL